MVSSALNIQKSAVFQMFLRFTCLRKNISRMQWKWEIEQSPKLRPIYVALMYTSSQVRPGIPVQNFYLKELRIPCTQTACEPWNT